jgi:hypothetical protein
MMPALWGNLGSTRAEAYMRIKGKRVRSQRKKPEREHLEKLLDEALKGTFPASDPVAIDIIEQPEGKAVADRPERRRQR